MPQHFYTKLASSLKWWFLFILCFVDFSTCKEYSSLKHTEKINCCLDSVFLLNGSWQISFQFRCFKILWRWPSITTAKFVSRYCVFGNSSGGLFHWSSKSFLNINVCIWQHRFKLWEKTVPVSKLGTWNH